VFKSNRILLLVHTGKPYPIVIESEATGSMPYNYKLSWATPDTGGLPILSYEIKLKEVGAVYYIDRVK